ncbi:MAG: DEAD/DEAH box helicase [Alphaproteobacteria bacterium]|jgi:superfamily II DNA/RNA helicase|nr:DEAD/DEAH box helicase [Alphaproteobacteria bacterium]
MTTDFSGFGLPPKLLQSLARMQFVNPTPIQSMAIPVAMDGRDILGSAQTGTGKTGAFAIPLIVKLMQEPEAMALIMTPTRELAAQVTAMVQQLIPVADIKTALLIGGEAMPKQFKQLQAKPRLIIGTPGRINDHLQRGTLKLGNVKYLVLDETDRMLDMGFGVQIDKILTHIPSVRQTMLFSATLPPDIVKLSKKYLTNPERISAGSTITAAPNIKQELIRTSDIDKGANLSKVLADTKGSIIIFVKTRHNTEKLATRLIKQNVEADAIHGDLRQSRRDKVIQRFRDKKFRVLVATDIAARGLDVPHIETVINYDLPQCPEDFIHRIGRTARAGSTGQAISFITTADQKKWDAIHKLMNPNAPDTARPPRSAKLPPKGKSKRFRNNKPWAKRAAS